MKKYIIIISLGIGILIYCLTCTYFDPAEAAGIKPQPGDTIFWINQNGELYRAPRHNPEEMKAIPVEGSPSTGIPRCIQADYTHRKIYWALDMAAMEYEIHRVNYDGSDIEMIYTTDQNVINSIAIDPGNEMVYFSEGMEIFKIPASGGSKELVYSHTGVYYISDITLDIANSKIYYVDGDYYEMYRVNMFPPPEEYEVIFNSISSMYQIAYDKMANQVSWVDNIGTTISSAKIDDFTNSHTVVSNCVKVNDLVSDSAEGVVYFLDTGGVEPDPLPGIYKANINGTGSKEEVLIFPGIEIVDIFTIDFLL